MKLLIALLLLSSTALGASETQCLSKMTKAGGLPQERVIHMLVQCSNMYLKGQFGYLQQKTRLSAGQKGAALMEYAKCEETSKIINDYMKQCMGGLK